MTAGGPPPDVEPAAIFLALAEWRPRYPLTVRLEAAPDVALWAQAAPGASIARAGTPEALAALCVVTEAGEPVLGPDTVGHLLAPEWRAIQRELWPALHRICPTYGRCNERAWIDTLKIGARQNRAIEQQMRGCFDIVRLAKVMLVPRPDRFFGRPACEVLDGHLMMFRAVQDLLLPN